MTQQAHFNVVVGGHEYIFTRLGGYASTDLFNDILQILAPSLAGGMGTLIGGGKDAFSALLDGKADDGKKIDPEALIQGLMQSITRADKEQQRQIMQTLGSVCHHKSGDTKLAMDVRYLDTHFSGRPLDMYRWTWEGLKVQFDDFLSLLKGAIGPGMAGLLQGSRSQST